MLTFDPTGKGSIGTVLTIASFISQLAMDITGRLDASDSSLHHLNITEFGDSLLRVLLILEVTMTGLYYQGTVPSYCLVLCLPKHPTV